jgi:hypothetical protein
LQDQLYPTVKFLNSTNTSINSLLLAPTLLYLATKFKSHKPSILPHAETDLVEN